jgi:hypothetical protein
MTLSQLVSTVKFSLIYKQTLILSILLYESEIGLELCIKIRD